MIYVYRIGKDWEGRSHSLLEGINMPEIIEESHKTTEGNHRQVKKCTHSLAFLPEFDLCKWCQQHQSCLVSKMFALVKCLGGGDIMEDSPTWLCGWLGIST
jgi:hypothetical protein